MYIYNYIYISRIQIWCEHGYGSNVGCASWQIDEWLASHHLAERPNGGTRYNHVKFTSSWNITPIIPL